MYDVTSASRTGPVRMGLRSRPSGLGTTLGRVWSALDVHCRRAHLHHLPCGTGRVRQTPSCNLLDSRCRAQNTATVLVMRFLMGMAGSIGATLVGGTISDIYKPQE